MKNYDFVLVMPVYNEEDGIYTFLKSIIDKFGNKCLIIVIDDKSKDETVKKIESLEDKESLILVKLPKNLGHGGAFVHGMKLSLQYPIKIVITADGDGQTTPQLIQSMFDSIQLNPECVVELIRLNRLDGKIRKIISLATRILVFFKSGEFPNDANTPFRAYGQNTLDTLLKHLPQNTLVPNLWISILTRRKNIQTIKLKALSQPRAGITKIGSTWDGGKYRKYKKLIIFSSKAAFEFMKYK
jgi:glycosyltransferase involved in cell wall biosynthesis